jgi:hypothetical protein
LSPRSCSARVRSASIRLRLYLATHRDSSAHQDTPLTESLSAHRTRMSSRVASTRAASFDGNITADAKKSIVAGRHGVGRNRFAGRQHDIPFHALLNIFTKTGVDCGTDPRSTVWQGHWRTHYLPSCPVVQMAIAVLYLLQIIISGWRALLDPAGLTHWSLRLERDHNIMHRDCHRSYPFISSVTSNRSCF